MASLPFVESVASAARRWIRINTPNQCGEISSCCEAPTFCQPERSEAELTGSLERSNNVGAALAAAIQNGGARPSRRWFRRLAEIIFGPGSAGASLARGSLGERGACW
jgi:hypothetical protein